MPPSTLFIRERSEHGVVFVRTTTFIDRVLTVFIDDEKVEKRIGHHDIGRR